MCHEPVRVRKEKGLVVLGEIDGSAPHDCGREPLTILTLARADARAAVERTLRALAERQAGERVSGEESGADAGPATSPTATTRPRRSPRRNPAGTESRQAGTSRECPSCGNLMAGSGDLQVCLHCGA